MSHQACSPAQARPDPWTQTAQQQRPAARV